jgi:long-subunit acyl-CoA synthetase (AMP-forming)
MTYHDVLTIYGMMRAGFIPQLFSLRLPNADIICELMSKANAKALVYDETLEADVSRCPVPVHKSIPESLVETAENTLPELFQAQEEDIMVIFHTSGSTSGSPKLVRCSYRWFDCIIHKANVTTRPQEPGRQDVTVWM